RNWKEVCMARLASYTSKYDLCDLHLSIELVDSVINRLKKGKASGPDSLTAEHFQFYHPIGSAILAMLFSLMIYYHFVPKQFGAGIIVPIPKKDSKCQFNKFSDFRGITISSIVSKIFESCIIEENIVLFSTSEMQFGFKP